jgi:hypothetical protein
MKMASTSSPNDDLRPEYDATLFSGATKGKYSERFENGTNIVRIDSDLAAMFPTAESVNKALRFVQQLAQDATRLTSH